MPVLAPARTPAAPPILRLRSSERPPTPPPRRHRARRIAVAASLICLVPALVSYISALTNRSNAGIGIRTVEWLRDNGARGIVNDVENFYYTLTAPAKGGPALRALPQQAGGLALVARSHRVVNYYRPRRIRPIIHPALPGEGVWHATYAHGAGRPPVLITSFRPDASYPRLVAGVAWIDHTKTSTWLYPGAQEPSVSLPSRGPMEVPLRLRPRLVATFNSGFKLADERGGGIAVGGQTYAPLTNGLGTIVRFRSGRIDVVDWQGGPHVGPHVVFARQNLPLIVNNGVPNPNLSDGPEWGFTLGNAIRVWRSAVGVDRRGNLIYGAANDQTVGSLAAIMIRAGAVRAMELDINSFWVSFISYRHAGSLGAANLLPAMNRSPLRYLTQDDRDFFAVYVK